MSVGAESLELSQLTKKEYTEEISFERIPIKKTGKYVDTFFEKHPNISKNQDIFPDLLITNPHQKGVTMLFPGYKKVHLDMIMKGRTTQTLIENLDDTVGFVDFKNPVNNEELTSRGITDYFEQNNFKGVKLFGASFGGYFALRLASTMHKLKEEGFNIPIHSVVLVLAPTSRECFKTAQPRDLDLALGLIHSSIDGLYSRITGKDLFIPEALRNQRSEAARIFSMQPFKVGDFPQGFEVNYFATDSQDGKIDKVVNQPLAIKQLEDAGVKVNIYDFKPGNIGHMVNKTDLPKMNELLIDILRNSCR